MSESRNKTFMHRALTLAERGRGSTFPNPMVGAVIVRRETVVGEGYHRRAGGDHAEIIALRKAGAKAAGATLFVTLEPCCHVGRTGPCVEAIIRAGVARVVYAARDDDPRVSGRGGRRLRQAGIAVTAGVLREEARRLNEWHHFFHTRRQPFVVLKTAQSLDGRIATATGDSKWISGPEALRFSHQLRAEADGVLIGMGTLRKDNPALTVRLARGRNPYRLLLSRSLRFPARCRFTDANRDQRSIVVSSEESISRFVRTARGSKLIFWSVRTRRDGLLDLKDFLAKAASFGLRSLLVEGGGRLATSFLKEGLVDKYVVVLSPILLGSGVEAVGDLGIRRVRHALRFEPGRFESRGNDVVFVGYPKGKV